MAEQALQKHTPGPWVLDEAGIWSVAAGETVAQVCAPDEWIAYPDEELPGSVRDQLLANARLIAAAPDLLDLMHWAITAVDRLAEVTPSGALRTGIRAKADEIRAAIAKAEAAQ